MHYVKRKIFRCIRIYVWEKKVWKFIFSQGKSSVHLSGHPEYISHVTCLLPGLAVNFQSDEHGILYFGMELSQGVVE